MKKIALFVLLGFMCNAFYAQSSYNFSAGGSIGYNFESVYLWEYEVQAKPCLGYYIHVGYEYGFIDKFGIRVQFGIHQNYFSATIHNSKVMGYEYNIVLPIDLRYYFYDRWSVEAGASFQNYRDIDDFAFTKSQNIRTNLILGTSFRLTKNIYLNFKYSRIVSKPVEGFNVRYYSDHIFIGGSYLLGHKSKKPFNSGNDEKQIF